MSLIQSNDEAALKRIADEIMQEKSAVDRANQTWLGKHVHNDWDDDEYVQVLYDQFMQTVQQGLVNKFTQKPYLVDKANFKDYLRDCLDTLKWRVETELQRELAFAEIDMRTYQNGKGLADMAEGAIRKYLDKTETQQLIGV